MQQLFVVSVIVKTKPDHRIIGNVFEDMNSAVSFAGQIAKTELKFKKQNAFEHTASHDGHIFGISIFSAQN